MVKITVNVSPFFSLSRKAIHFKSSEGAYKGTRSTKRLMLAPFTLLIHHLMMITMIRIEELGEKGIQGVNLETSKLRRHSSMKSLIWKAT